MLILRSKPNCFFKVRKVIIDNDYTNFPYKIKVDKCIGICNDKDDPYFKVCLLDIVENVSIKVFDLISQKIVLKSISFHKSCQCDCLLDEKVCNNKQKWNLKKYRCECLKIKKCGIGYSWNVSNCRCELKKLAALVKSEECGIKTDEIKSVSENKTVTLIKKIKNCKPFSGVSILLICVSIILTGIIAYFYLKSRKNNFLPY